MERGGRRRKGSKLAKFGAAVPTTHWHYPAGALVRCACLRNIAPAGAGAGRLLGRGAQARRPRGGWRIQLAGVVERGRSSDDSGAPAAVLCQRGSGVRQQQRAGGERADGGTSRLGPAAGLGRVGGGCSSDAGPGQAEPGRAGAPGGRRPGGQACMAEGRGSQHCGLARRGGRAAGAVALRSHSPRAARVAPASRMLDSAYLHLLH